MNEVCEVGIGRGRKRLEEDGEWTAAVTLTSQQTESEG